MHTNIVVDAGSTSIKWAIVHTNDSVYKYVTKGWNASLSTPFPDLPKELMDAIRACKGLYYYGAGVSSEEKKNILSKILSSFNDQMHIEIEGDLLAGARALYGNDGYGLISILGTGSNIAYYENQKLYYATPSLGYLLSDEGSGNKIGSGIIKSYFYGTMPEKIEQLFAKKYDLNKEGLLDQLYLQPQANRYLAQFTEFLSEIKDPWKDALLMSQFQEFIENKILAHKNFLSVPIGFVGSIADVFRKQLEDSCKKYDIHNIQILAKPIDGLVDYHKRKTC